MPKYKNIVLSELQIEIAEKALMFYLRTEECKKEGSQKIALESLKRLEKARQEMKSEKET